MVVIARSCLPFWGKSRNVNGIRSWGASNGFLCVMPNGRKSPSCVLLILRTLLTYGEIES